MIWINIVVLVLAIGCTIFTSIAMEEKYTTPELFLMVTCLMIIYKLVMKEDR